MGWVGVIVTMGHVKRGGRQSKSLLSRNARMKSQSAEISSDCECALTINIGSNLLPPEDG